MYAVIAGAGEVGYNVAQSLYKEGYNLAIIENEAQSADRAENVGTCPPNIRNTASPTPAR